MSGVIANVASIVGICGGLMTIAQGVAKWRKKRAAAKDGGPHDVSFAWDLWSVNEKTIAAAVVGVAVYVGVAAIESSAQHHLGPVELASLSQTTALIVGVWYGPWAGLVTGAVGYPFTVIFTLWHSGGSGVLHTPFPPAYSVSDGLVGLTGGLLLLYIGSSLPKPSLEKILICCGIAATAVVVSDLLANAILAHQGRAPTSAVMFRGMVSDALCAVALLALALYFRPSNALTPSRSID
jgi:hypothetical protein